MEPNKDIEDEKLVIVFIVIGIVFYLLESIIDFYVKNYEIINRIIFCFLLGIIFVILWKIIKKFLKIIEIPNEENDEIHIEHYPDIPIEDSSPDQIAYLYYLKNNISFMDKRKKDILIATIINLDLKKYIKIYQENSSDEIKLKVNENVNCFYLSKNEREIYNLLKDAAYGRKFVLISDLNKYMKKHNKKIRNILRTFRINAMEELINKKVIDKEKAIEIEMYKTKFIKLLLMFPSFIAIACILITTVFYKAENNIIMFGIIFILLIIYLIEIAIIIQKSSILTDKGKVERARIKGLSKYLNDYSLIEDRKTIEKVLWEEFLVYAIIFGISKKVIDEFKNIYSEIVYKDFSYEENDLMKIYLEERQKEIENVFFSKK